MRRASTTAAEPEAFAKFLHGLVMKSLTLVRCEAVAVQPSKKRGEGHAIEFGQDAELIEATPTAAIVRASYGVRIVDLAADTESKGAELARLFVVYEVAYATDEQMTQGLFEVFREVSLRLHTIPFAREWLRETSARMGLDPVLLPLALAHPAAVPASKTQQRAAASKKR